MFGNYAKVYNKNNNLIPNLLSQIKKQTTIFKKHLKLHIIIPRHRRQKEGGCLEKLEGLEGLIGGELEGRGTVLCETARALPSGD